MATKNGRIALSFLTAALVAAPALAARPQEGRAELLHSRIMGLRSELGLNADHSFVVRGADEDELGQTHVRLQQTYKGVRVMGGEIIASSDRNGRTLPSVLDHKAGINLNVNAALSGTEALAVVHQDMNPQGAYAHDPKVELVIFPEQFLAPKAGRAARNADDFETRTLRHTLAYLVNAELENEADGTVHTSYLINAHTGAVIKKWNNLHTADATGTGNSQYSGTVSLSTNSITSGFEMSDVVRSMPFKTYNLNHATSGTGTIYTDADNTWGDGTNYVEGSSTTAPQGQTAGVDAHFGVQETFDYFKNVLGRNGINGAGKATYSRVHYDNSYDNAFWSDSCFCMTYGDGNSLTTLTSLDVAAHEMSHGVCANTANLTYSGESGGLNESNSDIFGAVVEIYSRNGHTLPAVANTNNAWLIGEQIVPPALRYMTKPSKDGNSKDAWYSGLGSIDVHYSSGPNNRMFFFLSQGASSVSTTDYYSSYTPAGFAGIGADKAARIWYRTLSTKLTSSSTYAAARTGAIAAVKELYAAGGPEEQAVWNAYAAINVGAAWSGPAALSATITAPTGNLTVASGTNVAFTGAAAGGTSPYTYSWTFGDGGTAATASASHTFTNTGTANVSYTVTFRATDAASATATATRVITVTPPAAPTAPSITSQPASQTVTAGATATFNVSASGTAPFTYQWRKNGTAISGATAASYTTPATTTADSGATFSVVVSNSVGSATSANATLTVNPVVVGTYTEVEANNTLATANAVGSSYTAIKGNLTVATDQDNFALTLAAGQKVTINMTGPTGVDWDLNLKNSAGTNLASSAGSSTTETVTYTNTGATAMTVYPNVFVYSGVSATPYNLALTYVTPPPAVTLNEVEPNNSIAAANVAADNVTKIVGYVASSTDNDYFKVNVGAGKTLKVVMTGPTGTGYDYDLYFYNAAGTVLARGTGSTTSETVSWANTSGAGTAVYVAVIRYAGSSTTTPYNLVVTR